MSNKRKACDDNVTEPRNMTGKALFVRDTKGELVTVRPGEVLPARVQAATSDAEALNAVAEAAEAAEATRRANMTEEDKQYEAYLGGKDNKRGNVWIQGANVASSDRAAFADSISATCTEERREAGKEYAPARAHDRNAKLKKSAGSSTAGGSYGGSVSLAEAKAGAAAAQAALDRAREASDDEDDEASLSMSASQLADRAMAAYNLPVSNQAQLDPLGNDLRAPQLERKLRKFLECWAEEAAVSTLEGKAILKDFDALRKRYSTVVSAASSALFPLGI